MIAHVLDMFPGIKDPVFICNREHLDEPQFHMEEILKELSPRGRIVAIDPHSLGPVHAILMAHDAIDPARPTVVNYCDFACYWDFGHFHLFTEETGCDGAIPCYIGFHPHMLNSTSYAYLRQSNGWVEAIQEKQPYTDDPMSEHASSGTYYFRTGELALAYCRRTIQQGLSVNGEYYVSLVYQQMIEAGLSVAVYAIQHFMQWGTPEDLADYNRWSAVFRRLAVDAIPASQSGTVMMPMAGAGARFAAEGFVNPKPLIPVSGLPMALQARRDLPACERSVFVVRKDLPGLPGLAEALEVAVRGARLVVLEHITEGAAVTCLLALDESDLNGPLTIGACDNGVLYDTNRFEALMADDDIDVIVWVIRGFPNAVRNPKMYGWVAVDQNRVTGVSVKVPLADPAQDPVIIGTFTFKRASDFRAAAERLVARGGRAGGEFHVDGCIEDAVAIGLNCVIMDVDGYMGWGTPDELRTFVYWQSCFHKWPRHPYKLESDCRVPADAVVVLAAEYAPIVPLPPGRRT